MAIRQNSLAGGSALSQGRYVHRTTQTRRGQLSLPGVGFQPMIAVFEQVKETAHLCTAKYRNTALLQAARVGVRSSAATQGIAGRV